ncbi:MAG: SDR family oxidoreductase [Tissierellia bacterium]|nr:SDR family oxidoreductase [Tissierellia bacterium]
MKKLEGKIAVVSASTKGIGYACAEKLAKEGAKVYLAARNLEKAQKLIDEKQKDGLNFDAVYFDATKPETFRSFVTDVVEKEGRIDILVNNFGTTDVKRDFDVVNTKVEDFLDIINMNLRSVFEPAKAAIEAMKENGGGSIINIGSVGGLNPDMQRTAYGVSKAALNFLTMDIATQYAKDNIRCNIVLPGYTETDAAKDNMSDDFLKAFLTTVPLNRPGYPEDLANAVLFLASDDSSYITGHILPVAGGFGMPTPMYPLYMMQGAKG